MTTWEFIQNGLLEKNKGFPIGIPKLNDEIGGLLPESYIVLGGEPKAGKTAAIDDIFLLSVYLHDKQAFLKGLEYTYFSYEISRVKKEIKFICYLAKKQYNKEYSPKFLSGLYSNKPTKDDLELVQKIIKEDIEPLFGIYDSKDKRIKKGVIDFYQDRTTPTGIRDIIKAKCLENGTYVYENKDIVKNGIKTTIKVLTGYVKNENTPQQVVILDHPRKMKMEQGFKMKENLDKVSEYFTEFKDIEKLTIICPIHINRSVSEIDNIKHQKDTLHPDSSSIKDSGNFSEDCTLLLMVFDPTSPKYKITKHFGQDLTQFDNNYRSLHIIFNRDGNAPCHFQTMFDGVIGSFTQL